MLALPAILFVVACFSFSPQANAAQTVPYKINFQGRLTNASGDALTGSHDMQFKLYTALSGGTYVWGETRTTANANPVSVSNGLFNVLIGEGTAVAGSSASLQAAITANTTLYIEVMVGGETMTPRSQFGSSAYAMNSDTLDGLDATAFGQLSSANSWTNTNLIRVTSSAAFSVQNASGVSMLTADTSTGELTLGNYNGGTSPIAGKLVIANTSNANTVSLVAGVTTASYTLTLPTAAGASGDCLKTSDTSGTLNFGSCGAGGGVTTIGSIDGGTANANGATITGANLYLQSASASYAGLVNTSTQVFAGAKTFNDSLTLAAAKTITMVGGDTASRPASPTEGMLYYDTDLKQLVTYSNGKWQADRSTSTKIVAASDASQAAKEGADYVADGADDQEQINDALLAAAGGRVYLTEGTFSTREHISIPNDTTLAGAGRGSIIKFGNINGLTVNMIVNTDTSTGTGVTVRDLQLDGNNTVNTSGTMHGIYFNGMGGGSGSSARQGANIINNWVNNFYTSGVYLTGSPNSTVIGNNVQGNSGNGIYISSSNRSNITNNISQGNGGSGIVLAGAISENVVANTIAVNGTAGIYINGGSNNNTIFGNNLYNNGGSTTNNAIYFPGSANGDFNTITNNTINDTAGSTSNYAIHFFDNTSNSNYLADNVFTSTLGTSTINDPAGTNNVYANQSRAEGGGKLTNRNANDAEAFGIQNASGTAIFTVDTASSQVEIGASTVAGKMAISDGSSNTVTIGVAALAGNYTVDLPTITANDTFCLQTKANCASGGGTLQGAYDASGSPATITTTAAKGVSILAGAVPTADIVTISNAGQGVTTAGVNGLAVNYVGGAAAVEGSGIRIDSTPGTTSGGTWSGLRIVANATGAVSGVESYGIKIEGPSSPGAGSEVGLRVASGFDIGVDVASGGLQLSGMNDPASPAVGDLRVYAKSNAGRTMLKMKGGNGIDVALQPFLGANRVALYQPTFGSTSITTSTTLGTTIGLNHFTSGTTASTTATVNESAAGAGSLFLSMKRTEIGTSTAVSTVGDLRLATLQFMRGSTIGSINTGGFYAVGRFGVSTYQTGARTFAGMAGTASALGNAEITTFTNILGFGCNTADTSFSFIHNDGSGTATKIALGANYPCNTSDADMYEYRIFVAPAGSTVYYSLARLNTTDFIEGSVTTDMPAVGQFLTPHFYIGNNTTAARAELDIASMYVETDN